MFGSMYESGNFVLRTLKGNIQDVLVLSQKMFIAYCKTVRKILNPPLGLLLPRSSVNSMVNIWK